MNSAAPATAPTGSPYKAWNLTLAAGADKDERVYGLGQGNWTTAGGAGAGCDGRKQTQRPVPTTLCVPYSYNDQRRVVVMKLTCLSRPITSLITGIWPIMAHRIVPFIRNGQAVDLLQRKFHVAIPFAYSTAGYGVLFNMPGYGGVTVGARGTARLLPIKIAPIAHSARDASLEHGLGSS